LAPLFFLSWHGLWSLFGGSVLTVTSFRSLATAGVNFTVDHLTRARLSFVNTYIENAFGRLKCKRNWKEVFWPVFSSL
ncbi:uncharacterized protein EI90DRAFT_3030703, partial [Cantharellus anzutake]|uniref:uncharacterized protein n=1 Tax=Cantharellus anzutake TaxID=1750568 RepID=UPI001904CC44